MAISLKTPKLPKPPEPPGASAANTPGLVPPAPAPTTSVKAPMKMGNTAVKMPKAKKLAGPLDKPSLFYKSETSDQIKHPSVKTLRDFLTKVKSKKGQSNV